MLSAMHSPFKKVSVSTQAFRCFVFASVFAIASLLFVPIDNAHAENTWLERTISPADARHLLARTGFDAAPELQLLIAGLTRQEAIDHILSGFKEQPQRPMPAWTNDVAPLYWTRRYLDDEERSDFDTLRDQELSSLRSWWIDEMLTSSSPQTERMVLFWHDHFATSYRGVNRKSMAMARQNQTFRELGMGDFESLLRAMIRDPALLYYLNNVSNRRAHPNENLARELMELFTLGEGNYDEKTVREAARALTGYGVSQNRNLKSRFNEWQHDRGEKVLFGETGEFDGDDLVSLLLKQPALDEHIARRFWHFLVADRAPTSSELDPLAAAFRASNHQISALYRSVLESEAFWHKNNRGALIKSPATLLIGAARVLKPSNEFIQKIPKYLRIAGQDLFAPPNVSGWKEGGAWITSGRLINRYTGLNQLVASTKNKTKVKSAPALSGIIDNPMTGAMTGEPNRVSNDENVNSRAHDQSVLNVRYASKHVEWANYNQNNGVANARIVFQDLRYGSRHWPIFSAWYRISPGGDPVFWLHNQECWPDCIKQWPPCSWKNEQVPDSRQLSIPVLGAGNNQDQQCHIDGLTDEEARLVDALLLNSVDILKQVLAEETRLFPAFRHNVKKGLVLLVDRMQAEDVVHMLSNGTATGRTSPAELPKIVQADSAKRAYPVSEAMPRSVQSIRLHSRQKAIYAKGFSWPTVLAPGIDVSELPGWSDDNLEPLKRAELYKRVEQWLLSPVYQVY